MSIFLISLPTSQMVTFRISWRDGHIWFYTCSFLEVLPLSCMTSIHMAHQSSSSSLTVFSAMRCIFTACFQSIVELCPQSFLFYKLFVQGRVIGHKQQKSILSTKADGESNGRDLLVYEWQGKPECQVRRQGQESLDNWEHGLTCVLGLKTTTTAAGALLALDTHTPPHHRPSAVTSHL